MKTTGSVEIRFRSGQRVSRQELQPAIQRWIASLTGKQFFVGAEHGRESSQHTFCFKFAGNSEEKPLMEMLQQMCSLRDHIVLSFQLCDPTSKITLIDEPEES